MDIEMLEQLAQPGGRVYVGDDAQVVTLDKVFDRVVSSGWAPRAPAFGDELERLEVSVTRGRCLEPFIMEGDVVYIDRDATPLPGDIVSFALSERMADSQNADLPPFDARPCKRGDGWLKLYATYHGVDFLFERYGHSMTTTFAACESPDAVPILHPVRNVRRNGNLLFVPRRQLKVADCSNLGVNAATVVSVVSVAGPVTAARSSTGTLTNIASISVGPFQSDATIVITCIGDWDVTTGGATDTAVISGGISTNTTSFTTQRTIGGVVSGAASTSFDGSFTIEEAYALPAGSSQTYYLNAITQPSSSFQPAGTVSNVVMKAEAIKR